MHIFECACVHAGVDACSTHINYPGAGPQYMIAQLDNPDYRKGVFTDKDAYTREKEHQVGPAPTSAKIWTCLDIRAELDILTNRCAAANKLYRSAVPAQQVILLKPASLHHTL